MIPYTASRIASLYFLSVSKSSPNKAGKIFSPAAIARAVKESSLITLFSLFLKKTKNKLSTSAIRVMFPRWMQYIVGKDKTRKNDTEIA